MRRLAILKPAVRGPLLGLWLFKVFAGFVVALPLTEVVAAAAAARYPSGDTVLWEPGGVLLLETLRVGRASIAQALEAALVVGALLLCVAQIPLAAVLAALVGASPRGPQRSRPRAFDLVPGFVFLGGLTILAQAALGVATLFAVTSTAELLASTTAQRTAHLGAAALLGVGLVLVAAVGVLEDVARASLALRPGPGPGALRPALRVLGSAPRALSAAWSSRALATLVLVGLGALVTSLVRVEQSGLWRVVGAAAAHQAVVAGWVLLRADWLRRAVDITEETLQIAVVPGGTAARSVARGDPSSGPGA